VKAGALLHSRMDVDEPRLRVYGGTGIVATRVVTTGTYQGQPFGTKERSTDLFVRELWSVEMRGNAADDHRREVTSPQRGDETI
jgi:hypothetical protein